MNLRDHDQPCEHSADWRGALGESSRRTGHAYDTSKTSVGRWCPGGAAISIDYEAATETTISALEITSEMSFVEIAKSIVDAALGLTDE